MHGSNQKETKEILEDVSAQNLMSNVTGTIPKNNSCFNTHSNPDTVKYPLLKTTDHKHSFDKLSTNGITLPGDELASIEYFWNAIKSASMVTLKLNYLFPSYCQLTRRFDPESFLSPAQGHPYFTEISQAYVQFSRVIRDFILKNNTIKKDVSPKAYRVLLRNELQRDGFQLLWIITYRNSPQLGGNARDLQGYVETLQVIDGEEITEFYERTLLMHNEIELQEDKTGQNNRLTYRFVQLLSEFIDIKQHLQ